MEWIYKYFSLTAVIAGLGFLIKYLIQKKIDSYFNTKLEDHKKELAVMTEKAKYDISRKLFDFEAYAIQKHTIYPELYHRMFEILQHLTWLAIQVKNLPNIKEFDKQDEIFFREITKLSKKITNASEYFNKNELFLSKSVALNYWKTLKLIEELETYFLKNMHNSSLVGDFSEKRDEISNKIEILKEVMYEELSYSHFEETKEKV
ncbi:hypothetical protein ACIP97_18035 [Peribacillus frigoritolerans]|uniref:hypothetical protein n=1 Tax=Peribacillus frigoritolerans TaxID=450367 RepID=UPI00381ADA28